MIRRRVSSLNGGSPSITLFRSTTFKIASRRALSSRSHGQASRNVGPFPKSIIHQL